jgi:hypothetical protein
MIWATWRMHRSIFLASIGVSAAFAIWLTVTGLIDEHAWTIFTSHHCSLNFPGSSPVCSSSYSGRGLFSSINSALCNALPVVLGLVLGVPIVAGEIQQNTNRLAWSQTITRTRWVITKIGVGALVTAGIMGALAPLIWWWTNVTERNARILPLNFDISGFVEVAYALFAFMLGVALGAVIRRIGWAFAAGIPIFVAVRLGERAYIRPGLLPPTSVGVSAYNPSGANDWVLNSGFLPLGDSAPPPGQTWASNDQTMARCQGFGAEKASHNVPYCEKALHLHYVVQIQPASHFWALQAVESAIFVAAASGLIGLTVLAVRRWRT